MLDISNFFRWATPRGLQKTSAARSCYETWSVNYNTVIEIMVPEDGSGLVLLPGQGHRDRARGGNGALASL